MEHGSHRALPVAVLGGALALFGLAFTDPVPSPEVIGELELLQVRFSGLARLLDQGHYMGYYCYPAPDWQFVGKPAERAAVYEYANHFWRPQRFDEAYAARINNTRLCSHWDALRLGVPLGRSRLENPPEISENVQPEFIEKESAQVEYVERETLDSIASGKLYRDPFYPNLMLGYVSTYSDFLLISVGPDQDLDILPIEQHGSGGLMVPCFTTTDTLQLAVTKACARLYDGPPDKRDSSIMVDSNLLYDPTNGISSGGDIVFHRRGGDNWMFSFQPDLQLTRKSLVPRDLRKTLQAPP
ncbi:hypothetical protein HZA57_06770 [Candidatus Poribacteria bacterium]|nr:hypothetical protein [Candidatus Poribacteria bacterium]